MRKVRAVLLFSWVLLGCSPQPPPPPPCSATATRLDFGEVEVQSRGRQLRVLLRNATDELQSLLILPLSPPFFAQPNALHVAPRSSGEVFITFAPVDGRLHQDELIVRSLEGVCELSVALRGLGSGAIRANPAELEFVLNKGETQTRELLIENSRRVPLTLDFAAQPPVTLELPDGRDIAAGGALRVRVTATLEQWLRNDVFMLVTSELDHLQVPINVVPSSPRLEVTPGLLDVPVVGIDLGSTPPGFTERVLRVRNVASSGDPSAPPLEVTGFTVSLNQGILLREGELTLTSLGFVQLREGQSAELAARFSPQLLGPRAFELDVQTNLGFVRVPFTTTAVVLPACGMRVSPADRLTLHEVADGGLEGEVTFDNIGNNVCTVDGLRLGAPTPDGFTLEGPVKEQIKVAAKSQLQVRIAGPRQADAGVIGALGYHVYQRDSETQSIAIEAP